MNIFLALNRIFYMTRYGAEWENNMDDWMIELLMYEYPDLGTHPLSREEHFRNAVDLLFPKGSEGHFVWHPWALDMLSACCKFDTVALAGSASCGKSDFLGLWGLMNFLVNPKETVIAVTSTDILGAKRRVWRSISRFYRGLPDSIKSNFPMVDSPVPEVYVRDTRGKKISGPGIVLLASDSKKNSSGKLRGFKGRLFFLGDEMSDISQAFVDVVMSNLSMGGKKLIHYKKNVHICAAANPNTYSDPFSQMALPVGGWETIDVNTGVWKTKMGGICLHFDGLKNPNYLARKNIWDIPPWEDIWNTIEKTVENLGEDSPGYWRDVRGFWTPVGKSNYLYTHQEIILAGADEPYKATHDPRVPFEFAGLDPAYGGDKAVLFHVRVWPRDESYPTLPQIVEAVQPYELKIKVSGGELKSKQLASQTIIKCEELGIKPPALGLDATSDPGFADYLASTWNNNQFVRVDFGGKASSLSLSDLDVRPAHDVCDRRVTELWMLLKSLLRYKVVCGLDKQTIHELTNRTYSHIKQGGVTKYRIEEKREMRRRLKFSPDYADAFVIALETIRQRVGIILPSSNTTRTANPFRDSKEKKLSTARNVLSGHRTTTPLRRTLAGPLR